MRAIRYYIFTLFLLYCSICKAQKQDSIFNKEYPSNLDKIATKSIGKFEIDKNGYYKGYDQNEKLIREGQFQKRFVLGYFITHLKRLQLEEGIWKYYNDKGQIIRKEEYKKGNLISTKVFSLISIDN